MHGTHRPHAPKWALLPLTAAGFLYFGSMTSCYEPMPLPEHLSIRLSGLSESLLDEENLPKRAEKFHSWLEHSRSDIAADREAFDAVCRPGDSENLTCMSFQILASAAVEVALRDCTPTQELLDDIEELNRIAGIHVQIAK